MKIESIEKIQNHANKASSDDTSGIDDSDILTLTLSSISNYAKSAGDWVGGKIDKYLRDRVVRFAAELVKTKINSLNLPIITGRAMGAQCLVYIDGMSFLDENMVLLGDGSFCVLEIEGTFTSAQDDAQNDVSTEDEASDPTEDAPSEEFLHTGFSAKIRMGTSNTWLCIGIASGGDDELDDEYDDEYDDEGGLLSSSASRPSQEEINQAAMVAACKDGFSSVWRNREMRNDFVRPIVIDQFPSCNVGDCVNSVASQAANFFEFLVIPVRVKKMKDNGEKLSAIAKKLGITASRAERAVDMTGFTEDQCLLELLKKYNQEIMQPDSNTSPASTDAD